MELDLERAEALARKYIGSPVPLTRIGWGVSGFVFRTADRRVLKLHKRQEGFDTEVRAYQMLRRRGMVRVNGLNIPTLYGKREVERIVLMDLVQPPFLLDFAGVHFRPPDFEESVVEYQHGQVRQWYGPNAHIVYAACESLKKIGIYYTDIRTSNINIQGHPSAESWTASDEPEDSEFY